ncbi:hypothetical protein I2I05_00725 [Hymenobacter sp. BT683]|uniref:Uncharacterized protein n=1 Tax=Hymenobacter jeongseonensis TaxID=2791027 RepID=A0ABS0IC25_9BACT|nr:hypothetical protein [Hymenobacter jeongseonensis]MBF9235908.1 hypothetical protein [Hymenobacter jeongseonensis]
MRRAARFGLLLALGAAGLPVAQAQTVPPAPAALPGADSVKIPPPTFVVDTARSVAVVTAEPSEVVTRPLAWRIGAAILVLTLTTLLLYNVRSR